MFSFHEFIIRMHNVKFRRGIGRIMKFKGQWGRLESRVESVMEVVVSEAKAQNMFESVFFLSSSRISELKGKLPLLQLSFGQHPLGFNENCEEKLAVEGGCSLTISQLVTGQVVCTLHPFSSSLLSRNEKYIVSRIFSSPDKMKDWRVKAQVFYLFSYAQVSSAFGAPTTLDWAIVCWLKAEHWWLHLRLGKVALNLLDKATGIALEKSSG